jgi:SET domain-containing protein
VAEEYLIRENKTSYTYEEIDEVFRFFITQQVNRFWHYDINFEDLAKMIYYPANLMNHSCDPTVFIFFKERRLILRACRDIKEGEMLTFHYDEGRNST